MGGLRGKLRKVWEISHGVSWPAPDKCVDSGYRGQTTIPGFELAEEEQRFTPKHTSRLKGLKKHSKIWKTKPTNCPGKSRGC